MIRYLERAVQMGYLKNIACIALILTVLALGIIGLDKHAESKVNVKSLPELIGG